MTKKMLIKNTPTSAIAHKFLTDPKRAEPGALSDWARAGVLIGAVAEGCGNTDVLEAAAAELRRIMDLMLPETR